MIQPDESEAVRDDSITRRYHIAKQASYTSDILRRVPTFHLVLGLSLVTIASAQGVVRDGQFEGNDSVVISNSKLELTVTKKGSTLASITLADDPEKLSPLWNPIRMARELGKTAKYDGGAGLFVCVDGFGPPSAEERAAGLPGTTSSPVTAVTGPDRVTAGTAVGVGTGLPSMAITLKV